MREVRITDPKTGGQKGKKLAQLGALDPRALMEVAKVAGFGAIKYARYNFMKGFDWSLSYDALQRHLHEFWDGKDFDLCEDCGKAHLEGEGICKGPGGSGLPHIAHAAWQCLCMLTFFLRNSGTDDRPPK